MDLSGTARVAAAPAAVLGAIDTSASSLDDLIGAVRSGLDERLPAFMSEQRWFANKNTPLESMKIGDLVPIPSPHEPGRNVGYLASIDVNYADGTAAKNFADRTAPERYVTALGIYQADEAADMILEGSELARIHAADGNFVVGDAITDPQLVQGLLHTMRGGTEVAGTGAKLSGQGAAALDDALDGLGAITVKPLSLHTSNTSVQIGGRDGRQYALKLVRRHDGTLDPNTPTRALDVWKGAYLTNEAGYANTPAVLGSAEHFGSQGLPRTVSVLQDFVPNDGDGWADALGRVKETLKLAQDGADPAIVQSAIDDYARAARNHGRRLGELHVALSSGPEGSEFRGVLQAADDVKRRTDRLMHDTARTAAQLRTHGLEDDAERLLAGVPTTVDDVIRATDDLVPIQKIHTHGDFHLGQMLRTGDDIHIIDLEGAPALPIAERWQRHMALEDVARQRSSYEYASAQAIKDLTKVDADLAPEVRELADRWAATAKDEFTTGWLDATADQRFRHARSEFVPELREADIANAVYETSYELGSRPDWVDIPLGRLRNLLDDA